ncbi:hypothetical protein KSC_090440 [Ktedonobacter sp. SOSP1-52]|nr:hypothetical protein KSC_090440 [Ktedonobacter sp. SOSP1-52]
MREAVKGLRVGWIADHIEAVLAQTLASRAYCALNRVCLGKAKQVRFKSRGRGLSSIENKRNDTSLRFVLQPPDSGNAGYLLWNGNRLPTLIGWKDEVVTHGLRHRIKFARLIQRPASSPKGEASLQVFCKELAPEYYDEQGRIKKQGNKKLRWKQSKRYQATRRRKAAKERKLAAHRKSLHGRKVHEVVALGNTIILEKISYKAWQKQFGKSVGLRAPGMFVELLRRTVASTGGTLVEVPTRTTALSQWCHGCGKRIKKSLSQRWHQCSCGVGPVQRDLYSAFLAASLDPAHPLPSCARYQAYWEGAQARLRAAHERLIQSARDGQSMPQSFGLTRAGARLPNSWNPRCFHAGSSQEAWNETLGFHATR